MALSERGRAILTVIERDLPSRKALAGASFGEKLDFLDRLKRATDEYERILRLEQLEREEP
jgi:hypothetical protein